MIGVSGEMLIRRLVPARSRWRSRFCWSYSSLCPWEMHQVPPGPSELGSKVRSDIISVFGQVKRGHMLKEKRKVTDDFLPPARSTHMSLLAGIGEWEPPSSLTHERTPSRRFNENDDYSAMGGLGAASPFGSQTPGSQAPQYHRTVLGPSNRCVFAPLCSHRRSHNPPVSLCPRWRRHQPL